MAAPQVVDVASILSPIAGDLPGGSDPRADTSPASLYYRVKDARTAARSAERAAVEVGAAPPEEWDVVLDAAVELLAEQAKDLEVAAWLAEALVRREGFAGLRDGLAVITGIAEAFWDTSFPALDEDGVEGKLTAVAGLNGSGATGTLIQPIRLIPLTEGSLASFSLWHYDQATELEKITDPYRKQARIDDGAVTMEQFQQSVAETPGSAFLATVELIEECVAGLARMGSVFDAAAGVDAPPLSALRDLLQQILGAVRHFAADKLAAAAALSASTAEDMAATAEAVVAAEGGAAGGGGTVTVRRIEGYASRDEALAELTRISTYFRKTEPHSPISYTLEDAVRRARLSLPELLLELAEDPSHIQRILLAAGIRNIETAA